jgi:solute carrier family 25 phosphate transporter 3
MLRQIPYTCAKLAGYEIISDTLKNVINNVESNRINSKKELKSNPISEANVSNKILIQLGSGILAGVLAAVISQPADVLLSKVCGEGKHALTQCLIINSPLDVVRAFQDLGFRTCYSGLQPRAIMVGSLTAMQFVLYEQLKEKIMKIDI